MATAWLYQRGDSRFWWIAYRIGKTCHFESTKQSDRGEAEKVLAQFNSMAQAQLAGALTEKFYQHLTGAAVHAITLKGGVDEWLRETKLSSAKGTAEKYSDVAKQLVKHFKATDASPLLREITPLHVGNFLRDRRKVTAASSANLCRKIITAFFNRCVANRWIFENPANGTKPFKVVKSEKSHRRAFTTNEIRLMLDKAPDDFWRFMITGGVYTGLRLGDLVQLRSQEVDLQQGVIRLEASKTGRNLEIPIAAPLYGILRKHDDRRGYLWPDQAKLYQEKNARPFSNDFFNLVLVPAGLVKARPTRHIATKNGRHAKRDLNDVSFHSFRHTFVSLLKISGASQAVAKELAGHSSNLISDLYTHLPAEVMKKAIDQLPEVAK